VTDPIQSVASRRFVKVKLLALKPLPKKPKDVGLPLISVEENGKYCRQKTLSFGLVNLVKADKYATVLAEVP